MDNESRIQSQSLTGPRSESKVLPGQKRAITEAVETYEYPHKRLKLRDLESVQSSKAQVGLGGSNTAHPDANSNCGALNLNVSVGPLNIMVGVDAPACLEGSYKHSTSVKEARDRRLDLDLNAEDISSVINDPFHTHKNYENLKLKDDSECGSSVGSLDEKDSMRVWEGLKQNNFMSTSYGDVPVAIPKARGRKKSNNDAMKKKIELAKKEQVDRFAKLAAPSGLLHGLNPGIINHVRNRKQVHSIIEALVTSEKTEHQHSGDKQLNRIKSCTQKPTEREDSVEMHTSGVNVSGLRRQMGLHASLAESDYSKTELISGDYDSFVGERRVFEKMLSQHNLENRDDGLALKLSSSVTVASENTTCLSNEESGNLTSVASLSVKAANVASQWLELLNQDIRGRLAALRRSKKRVQAVITQHLPLLLSREFSSNLEKGSYMTEGSTTCHFDKALVDAHAVRWSTLFARMVNVLSEEESHLESWLNQVKEMQLHCERGLHKNSLYHASQEKGPVGSIDSVGEANNSEKDLAVRAAAASIYSTCNFLLSMENLPSC